MNGGHLGFGQYGAHGGSPAWLPRKIKSMWPGLQVVQIWCLWNDLNNYMIKPPDYNGLLISYNGLFELVDCYNGLVDYTEIRDCYNKIRDRFNGLVDRYNRLVDCYNG